MHEFLSKMRLICNSLVDEDGVEEKANLRMAKTECKGMKQEVCDEV